MAFEGTFQRKWFAAVETCWAHKPRSGQHLPPPPAHAAVGCLQVVQSVVFKPKLLLLLHQKLKG